MRPLGLLALVLPLLPLAATAQPAGKTKAFADCAALVASMPEILTGQDSRIEDIDGGCRVTNIDYSVSSYLNYGVDQVTLLAPNLLTTFPTGEIFESATLELEGMRVKPVTGSPLQDYILALNSVGMNLRLAYTTEPEALTSAVDFEFSAEKLGRVALTAALSNFDNTDVDDIEDISDVTGTLNQLDLTLEDSGLFAVIFAPALVGGLFPEDEDPTSAIMVMQETAVATLAGLPETILSPDSFVALSTLIRALPRPEGDWHLTFASEKGISIEDLDGNEATVIAAILAGAKITATGKPAAE